MVRFDPTEAARKLEQRLRGLGTPERAAGEKRYLKSEREHLGVTVPDNRRAVRTVVIRRPEITHDGLAALVRALWRSGPYDCRLAAVLALEARPDAADVYLPEDAKGALRAPLHDTDVTAATPR